MVDWCQVIDNVDEMANLLEGYKNWNVAQEMSSRLREVKIALLALQRDSSRAIVETETRLRIVRAAVEDDLVTREAHEVRLRLKATSGGEDVLLCNANVERVRNLDANNFN